MRTDASPEAVAAFGHNLGTVLDRLGRLSEAEVIHRRAVAAAEEAGLTGDLKLPLVAALCGLAVNLRTQERLDEAEVHLRRALALAEISPTSVPPSRWGCCGSSPRCTGRRVDWRRARRPTAGSGCRSRPGSGSDHPEAAHLYRHLALLEQTRGRHEVGEAIRPPGIGDPHGGLGSELPRCRR